MVRFEGRADVESRRVRRRHSRAAREGVWEVIMLTSEGVLKYVYVYIYQAVM